MDRGRVELDEVEEVDRSQIILCHHLPLEATISNIHHVHLQLGSVTIFGAPIRT